MRPAPQKVVDGLAHQSGKIPPLPVQQPGADPPWGLCGGAFGARLKGGWFVG
jgi:hypothetical protein